MESWNSCSTTIRPHSARHGDAQLGNGHLGLASEDIHADYERLRDLSSSAAPPPSEIPSGPARGGWAIYLRDPDGITVEIVQAPPG